jgi:uncharacterized cupredoxin-like copper-binding protein
VTPAPVVPTWAQPVVPVRLRSIRYPVSLETSVHANVSVPSAVAEAVRPVGTLGKAGVMAVAVGVGRGLASAGERTIEIDIRYSHFEPASVRVPAGVPVRFVLVNHDPIDHEWILGDDAIHAVHRTGTEAHHGARPTEQEIAAGARVETVVTFTSPGALTYICHLPGHEAYGMVGTLIVTD